MKSATMGRLICSVAFAAIIVLGLLNPADAHHSFAAEFDAQKPLRLTGSVTRVEWQNPHAWFYIDVKRENGQFTNWGFELGSPNVLARAGWSRNSLKIGDEVAVEGSRARDGSNVGNAQAVTLTSTGQRLFAGSSQPGIPQQ
jgi:hypothetical protein